ncbi:MAG TPA: MMPL family transporter [Gammaproteobacteria bacterium]|nr:MMPL family transporter [Gammaproteobacteria bacterium]
MSMHPVADALAAPLFRWRRALLALFVLVTLLLGWSASQLRVDAGFEKMIPLEHEYMQTFTAYRNTFGGANRVLVALRLAQGDIYQAEFLDTLRAVTDEVFFIPGVDRATVTSLFTPNVRFIEVVEAGFAGGNLIPADYDGSEADLEQVRSNVLKSDYVGRLVANDHGGALVSAELLEIDPATGERLDYARVAERLEEIRARHAGDGLDLHIIGFAKAVGDITDGAEGVLVFFLIAFLITAAMLYGYSGSGRLTILALVCALVPVVWLLGLLPLLGYGIDPMSILVPFLIFSIGVSHAVQMTNAWKLEVLAGGSSLEAARTAFRRLFVPGAMALLANALGFMVIIYIQIEIVRELAITASLGVALMIITNKMLLPVLLSWTRPPSRRRIMPRGDGLWRRLGNLAQPRRALLVLIGAALLVGIGAMKSRDLRTGNLGVGNPELHDHSRYNRDVAAIVESFSIGVNVLAVIAQSQGVDGACTDYAIMDTIDRFAHHMRGVHGVQDVMSLPGMAKRIHAGWNEGNPRWQALPLDPYQLAQAVTPIDTASGLLNTDCNAMQVLIFTRDHQGDTIAHIVEEVKRFSAAHNSDQLTFLLAAGNVGVMAATNEAVDEAEVIMLLLLFSSIGLLCLAEFRSWRAMLCIIVPLVIVAVLCNALMALLDIGLKVSTLPVIALGVGVGVDYGIYLYERIQHGLRHGRTLVEAYQEALRQRGTAVAFTALTMSIGVGTWAFSALKFQADMGILLAFMFLVNLFGALLLLPALAALLRADTVPGWHQ